MKCQGPPVHCQIEDLFWKYLIVPILFYIAALLKKTSSSEKGDAKSTVGASTINEVKDTV